MALAALPSILGPAWSPTFPGACTAPTFLLIAMLQMSPSSAVGVRLINVASLLGPAVVGSLAGGGAASLAAALDPRAGAAFAAVLAAAAVPILAAAAVVRGAPHAPAHVAGMGLVIALSAGSTMLGAASALAAARNAAAAAAVGGGRRTPPPRGVLHAHWWMTVVPTLAAFGVAGAATVVASLLFPSLASTDVEAHLARASGLRGSTLARGGPPVCGGGRPMPTSTGGFNWRAAAARRGGRGGAATRHAGWGSRRRHGALNGAGARGRARV